MNEQVQPPCKLSSYPPNKPTCIMSTSRRDRLHAASVKLCQTPRNLSATLCPSFASASRWADCIVIHRVTQTRHVLLSTELRGVAAGWSQGVGQTLAGPRRAKATQ